MSEFGDFKQDPRKVYFSVKLQNNNHVRSFIEFTILNIEEKVEEKTKVGNKFTVEIRKYDPIYIVKEELIKQNPQLRLLLIQHILHHLPPSGPVPFPSYQFIRFIINDVELSDNLDNFSFVDDLDITDFSKFNIILNTTPIVDNDVTHAYQMEARQIAEYKDAQGMSSIGQPSSLRVPVSGGGQSISNKIYDLSLKKKYLKYKTKYTVLKKNIIDN
jgi:hypothetical protein